MTALRTVANPVHAAYGASTTPFCGEALCARRTRSAELAASTAASSTAGRSFFAAKNVPFQPTLRARFAASAAMYARCSLVRPVSARSAIVRLEMSARSV